MRSFIWLHCEVWISCQFFRKEIYVPSHSDGGAYLVAQMVKNLPAMQETGFDLWRRGLATHSSSLAWRIPQTEDPGWLQSMGSQRVERDWMTNTFTVILLIATVGFSDFSSSLYCLKSFSGNTGVKTLPVNAGDTGDLGSIPGWGRSPGGGNGNPLQYFCLENPMDRGAWWSAVHRVAKSWTWLSTHAFTYCL